MPDRKVPEERATARESAGKEEKAGWMEPETRERESSRKVRDLMGKSRKRDRGRMLKGGG